MYATTNTKSFSNFTLNYFTLVDFIMPKVRQCNMLHSGKKRKTSTTFHLANSSIQTYCLQHCYILKYINDIISLPFDYSLE